ncbi:PREDICTED: flavin-containing monooxygenase FMO GS-OX4-like [Priapulus caudatus]|uniref:Flavin-containing monooxygenase n=1 Tax=Priapulus caudatus TaxID=37621 RepID=A0ABM1F319_PRICU|nr:PREDICTED: flavin-containing monooxygenase FMO GS-OX4-like [Priapulus caudatus]XP_014678841.1 PREDICTED: flavin-containing monooxygenase FMO GS-OX4-like [Priapulus caudatus]
MAPLRVAVIGAGPSGLIAARMLASRPQDFDFEVYERGDNIGGTWVYTERTGLTEDGFPVHSSMYKNLITNLPTNLMEFPDFPFPSDSKKFIHWKEVQDYLHAYADHFNLRKDIQLNTDVTSVKRITTKPVPPGDAHQSPNRPQWLVRTNALQGGGSKEKVFDAVLVCCGHFNVPLYPDIPGQESFRGVQLHSHDYRHPEPYAGKRVLLMGAFASAFDIMKDLYPHTSEVIISLSELDVIGLGEQYKKGLLPHNVRTTPFPQAINGSAVTFTDGETLEPDVIIFCTGYKYSFPFLDASCDVTVSEGKRIQPLFMHMIHSRYYTLMFIAMPYTGLDFLIAYLQVPIALMILDGSLALPSEQDMNQDTEADYRDRLASGQKLRHVHKYLYPPRWSYTVYYDEIATFAKIDNVMQPKYRSFEAVFAAICKNVMTYRD